MRGPASTATLREDARRLLELLHAMAASAFRPILWKRAVELELTYAQAQVLLYVQRRPGCPASAVARAFGVTLPAVSRVIERLTDKGLLLRQEDPRDRRQSRLRVTRAGETLARELESVQVAGLAAALRRLSPDARRRALAALGVLVAATTREA